MLTSWLYFFTSLSVFCSGRPIKFRNYSVRGLCCKLRLRLTPFLKKIYSVRAKVFEWKLLHTSQKGYLVIIPYLFGLFTDCRSDSSKRKQSTTSRKKKVNINFIGRSDYLDFNGPWELIHCTYTISINMHSQMKRNIAPKESGKAFRQTFLK